MVELLEAVEPELPNQISMAAVFLVQVRAPAGVISSRLLLALAPAPSSRKDVFVFLKKLYQSHQSRGAEHIKDSLHLCCLNLCSRTFL